MKNWKFVRIRELVISVLEISYEIKVIYNPAFTVSFFLLLLYVRGFLHLVKRRLIHVVEACYAFG